MIYFQADNIRQKLNGSLSYKAWGIELMTESPQYSQFIAASGIKEKEFWDVFFRHNNFFIEKNSRMFPDMTNKDQVRADSIMNLANVWITCKVGDISEMVDHVKVLKNKYKFYREVPEYALQQAEEFLCPVLDGRCPKEDTTKLSPEIWFPVLQFLDVKEQINLAKTCRSLYSDIRNKVIGKLLMTHPELNGLSPFRKTLWLALIPKVDSFYQANQRSEIFASRRNNEGGRRKKQGANPRNNRNGPCQKCSLLQFQKS